MRAINNNALVDGVDVEVGPVGAAAAVVAGARRVARLHVRPSAALQVSKHANAAYNDTKQRHFAETH